MGGGGGLAHELAELPPDPTTAAGSARRLQAAKSDFPRQGETWVFMWNFPVFPCWQGPPHFLKSPGAKLNMSFARFCLLRPFCWRFCSSLLRYGSCTVAWSRHWPAAGLLEANADEDSRSRHLSRACCRAAWGGRGRGRTGKGAKQEDNFRYSLLAGELWRVSCPPEIWELGFHIRAPTSHWMRVKTSQSELQ